MKKTILSSLLAIAAAAPIASQAASGTITFNGTITSQTCTINGGSPNFTIPLGNIPASALARDGDTANVVNDSIKMVLTACTQNSATPPANGAVRARFEGGPTVDSTTHRLINTGAANVQVGITRGGLDIAVGATDQSGNNPFTPITGTVGAGSATLVYGHKVVATGGAAGTGAISTNVQYSLDFM